jgi:8-oxo-dGTP pyrophosphatase MutT (NUDIX family)
VKLGETVLSSCRREVREETGIDVAEITVVGVLSFPKIISEHIGGAVQPGSEWRQWRQIVGLLDARAHLSPMPNACALDYKYAA